MQDASVVTCWVWAELPPSQRRARFRSLYRWVTWLKATYDAHRLVYPCWYEHPYVREELKDLWVAWIRTYKETGGAGHLAFPYWQDARDRALARIKRNLDESGCTSHDHKQPYQPAPIQPGRHPDELFAAWLAKDPWISAPPSRDLTWQAHPVPVDRTGDSTDLDRPDQLNLPETDI